MPEFYSLPLALSLEINRIDAHQRDLVEVKHDCWSTVFNQRPQLPKMLRAIARCLSSGGDDGCPSPPARLF